MEELYFQEYMDKKCLPYVQLMSAAQLRTFAAINTNSCVTPTMTPWVVAWRWANKLFLSVADPCPTPPLSSLLSGSNQERRGEGSCCRVTGAGGLTGLMRKFWWLESGNVRGEVWRRRQPFAVVRTLFSCMVSRLWGTSLFTRPTEKLCPAACSGCTVSYF